jgi:hypothetical protein
VLLKPDPGNPQELYLGSLEALGIDTRAHDLRFVEDNWESPVLGAWGLGWEVWLDGMEAGGCGWCLAAQTTRQLPPNIDMGARAKAWCLFIYLEASLSREVMGPADGSAKCTSVATKS